MAPLSATCRARGTRSPALQRLEGGGGSDSRPGSALRLPAAGGPRPVPSAAVPPTPRPLHAWLVCVSSTTDPRRAAPPAATAPPLRATAANCFPEGPRPPRGLPSRPCHSCPAALGPCRSDSPCRRRRCCRACLAVRDGGGRRGARRKKGAPHYLRFHRPPFLLRRPDPRLARPLAPPTHYLGLRTHPRAVAKGRPVWGGVGWP